MSLVYRFRGVASYLTKLASLFSCIKYDWRPIRCDPTMGVNHGGQGTSPPEFGVGDANANSHPDFEYQQLRRLT